MMNLGRCGTSFECWKQLVPLYENKTHDTTIAYIRNLHQLRAVEGDNIPKHLVELRQYYLCINLTADPDFKISDAQFKVIISSSLPPSWDTFTEDYMGRRTDVEETNPKKLMPSQQFIGIIREEYLRRTERANDESINFATQKSRYATPKPNLAQRIGNSNKWCSHCKRPNHNDADCLFLNNAPLCNFCQLKGHLEKNCRKKKRQEMKQNNGKKRKAEGQKEGNSKKQKKDVTNMVQESTAVEEVITLMADDDDGQYFNYDTFNVSDRVRVRVV